MIEFNGIIDATSLSPPQQDGDCRCNLDDGFCYNLFCPVCGPKLTNNGPCWPYLDP